jgi:hypothetical protein
VISPPENSAFTLRRFWGWKIKGGLGTVCHGQNPIRIQLKQLNFIEAHGFCPLFLRNIQANHRESRQKSDPYFAYICG